MFVGFCKFPIVFSEIFSTFASEIGEKTEAEVLRTHYCYNGKILQTVVVPCKERFGFQAGDFFITMERQIKGIFIPIEVWENKELSWNEKILLMEIDSFTSRGVDCFFSNEYIAELLGVKENTASIILSKLVDKGYVTRTRFDGRHRYVESNIGFSFRSQSKADFDENQTLPMTEIKPDNNKINNKPILTLEEKRRIFREKCEPYIQKYGAQMVEDFCRYWCEADSKGVMACEKAKKKKGTFEIGGRLATWAGKDYNRPSAQKPLTIQPKPQKPKKTPWEEMGITREEYVELTNGGFIK